MSANASTRKHQGAVVSNMIAKRNMFLMNNSPPSEHERFLQRQLARLYDASKPELCFYAQDSSGYPSNPPEPVSTTMSGQTFYPQVVRDYVVDEDRGLKNKTVEDMLGHPSYGVSIPCGMPRKNGKGGQKLCRVDPCRKGSALCFLSHSCKPNAQLVRGRIGSDRYVIAAEALDQDIQPGHEICIDYGDGWFEKDEFCLCGHAECRKPPPQQ